MIVGGSKCAHASKDCRAPLQWHHAIKQQRLKKQFPHGAVWLIKAGHWVPCSRYDPVVFSTPRMTCALKDIISDQRNMVWLCSHHHELVTNGRLKVQLPESVYEFADEFGLRAQLENDIARAA